MGSVETQIVVGVVTIIISVVINTVVSSYVKKGEKEDERVDEMYKHYSENKKKEERQDKIVDTLWDSYHEKKQDSDKIDKLIDKIDGLKEEYNDLDSHVRHEVANLRTSVNGFGSRLSFIEEEAKNRDRLGHELRGKVDLLEKFILDKR